MKFLKTLLACLLAIFISSVIGIIVIVAIVSPGESQYVSKPNTVLKLELKGEIVETSEIDLNGSLQKALKGEDQPLVLGDIINAILEAKSDDNIKGIYLTTDGYLGSYVASTEIVRNLKAFKETGKFIVAYNDFC